MPLRFHKIFQKNQISLMRKQELDFQPEEIALDVFFRKLKTSNSGLTSKEAKKRLFIYGQNQFKEKRKTKLLHEVLLEFANPLIILLLVLGTFSVFFGDKFSAIIIFVMAFMSAFLSFFQEHRAERAVEKLNALVRVTTLVLREGAAKEINIKDVVPGDIVSLSAGDIIPADMRLISSNDLYVSESSLTGESLPLEKISTNNRNFQSTRPKQTLVYMGSSVVSGTGLGAVFYTGQYTKFGEIVKNLSQAQTETSFDKGIKSFTWLMIRAILFMIVVILAINLFANRSFFDSLLFALAVAVGIAPETLPMIVTINLSKGALLMSKKKVVVKRLDAIQNLGAMDVLCTDKTGTLTLDEVVLEQHTNVFGQDDNTVLEFGFINSFYQTGLKNLLDKAVLKHKHPHLQNLEKIGEIPFDFIRKIMSVVVEKENKPMLIAKGAPEEIFKRSSYFEAFGQTRPLLKEDLEKIEDWYKQLSQEGFRVLALAYRNFEFTQSFYSARDESSLVLKGFMAFLDPAKPDAKNALDALEKVGVKIKIITGDNELVTEKICKDIGIEIQRLVTGAEVEKFSDKELSKVAEQANVFTRMLPMQKQRIIKILQNNGHTVGFLGDGINDSPALRLADVGISVNNAAEVARESASIILLEKSLDVLNDGVIEGRKVFGNIIKYLRMSSSSNFGNMLSMTGASLILPFLPMLPVQILLNNFLYDVSQIGIPTDEVDREYVEKPRPWRIEVIKKFMVTMGPISSIFDFLTFAMMWWVFQGYLFPSLFQTGWFIESLLSQTLVVYVIRTRKLPFLQSWPSKSLVLTTVLVVCAGVFIPYTKLAGFFGFSSLPVLYYILLFFIMIAYLFSVQIIKNWFIKKFENE